MSLNYQFGKVANWKELHSDDKEWAKTEHLIWHCVAVEMSGITEKNWKQFAQRYLAWHKVRNTPENGMVSVADIKRRIGLWTNVGTTTDHQFNKSLVKILLRNAEFAVRIADETVC